METVCQLSYPRNSENASPPGTCTVYLPCPASCAVTTLPPTTPSTTSEATTTTTAPSALRFISAPPSSLCAAIQPSSALALATMTFVPSAFSQKTVTSARVWPFSTRRLVTIPRVVNGSFGHSTLVNSTSRRPPRSKPRPNCRVKGPV